MGRLWTAARRDTTPARWSHKIIDIERLEGKCALQGAFNKGCGAQNSAVPNFCSQEDTAMPNCFLPTWTRVESPGNLYSSLFSLSKQP